MQQSRRKFLKYFAAGSLVTATAGSWWAATSQRRSARWLRTIVADAKRTAAASPVKPSPDAWKENGISICWLGHATVLISFYGIKILTDPAFGDRCGVYAGLGTLGPKRYTAPALGIRELPDIDLVLLSHAHMDHMDTPSLRRIKPSHGCITAKLTTDILPKRQQPVHEMAWGEKKIIRTSKGELEFEAFEVKHWGQRWPSELERGYNGYIIRRENRAIIFGGDTAYTPLFEDLHSKGPFEAAIMPIGAYRPWIWNHCDPEEAVKMLNAAGADYIVPVHHQTWKLSHEPFEEPLQRLEAALEHEPERIGLKRIGETLHL